MTHPLISGNKFRKLKYNLIHAKAKGFSSILTFGGAFSNHIAATAYAGKKYSFRTIGIIRGNELFEKWSDNPTLQLAHDHGMRFNFISRAKYRERGKPAFIKNLEAEFGQFYLLPEGGTNALAVGGCEEILGEKDVSFDAICCSVGTGGTLAGISNAAHSKQQVLGFAALKGDFLQEDIRKFAPKENWKLYSKYHFGGYAKINVELVNFINDFRQITGIPLDPIYTGKLIFGILDLVQKDYFSPKTKILAIHTGGLQGIAGMNENLKKKNLPLICV